MQNTKAFEDVITQSLIDTGVAEKIIHAVTATCVTYAKEHELLFAGFSDDFVEALFYEGESKEIVRVPYDEVKEEAFKLLETNKGV